MDLHLLNIQLESDAKNSAEIKFNQRLDAAVGKNEAITIHGLQILKKLYSVSDSLLSIFVLHQTGTRRKNIFFREVLQEAIKDYNLVLMDKEVRVKPSNPVHILSYILAEGFSSNILGNPVKLTALSKSVLSKAVFALGLDKDKLDHTNVLAGIMSLVRSVCNESENIIIEQAPDSSWIVDFTEDCKEEIILINNEISNKQNNYIPMVVKPIPHNDLLDGEGGYYTLHSPLLKTPTKMSSVVPKAIRDVSMDSHKAFFTTINKLQDTGYVVDVWQLLMLERMKEEGITCHGFEWDIDSIEKKARIETDLLILNTEKIYTEKGWVLSEFKKKETFKSIFLPQVAKQRAALATIETAKDYFEFDAIYFPLFTDNRYRIYPYVTNGLSYQGNTLGKSLLSFSEGCIVNEEGLEELWIQLGGFLGEDKLKEPLRATYAKQFKSMIWSMMEEGSFEFVRKAIELEDDTALEAIKFAKEVYYASTNEWYVSSAICHKDSTSSGIQIGGLLQHDKGCAEGTNLINKDGTHIADAYKTVADKAVSTLQELAIRRKLSY